MAKMRWTIHTAAVLSLAVMGAAAIRRPVQPRPAVRPEGARIVSQQRPPVAGAELKTAPEPPPAEVSEPRIRSSRSFRLRSTEFGEIWVLDPLEAAKEPHEGLDLRPEEGGGVRVHRLEEADRVGFAQAFQEGDVIRRVNGIIVRDGRDVRFLPGRLFLKSPVVRVSLERGGRPMCIAYKRGGGTSWAPAP